MALIRRSNESWGEGRLRLTGDDFSLICFFVLQHVSLEIVHRQGHFDGGRGTVVERATGIARRIGKRYASTKMSVM